MADKQPLTMRAALDPLDTSTRYVWDVEDAFPTLGEVEVFIGDLSICLDLRFPHERRYAMGFLFAFRNPQSDIDRYLLRAYVQQGDVVLDVGANIGVTAAEALACGAGHVICVEPENSLVNRLRRLQLLSPDRISIWHCALGVRVDVADLFLSHAHNQGHTISSVMIDLFPQIFDGKSQKVNVSTVDTISLDRPSAIWKIDAEGAEPDVIRGAHRTLEHTPPRVILAELYDPVVNEVVALLSGYSVRRAALTRTDYTLQLFDQVGGPLPDEFCPTSPTYVFTRLDGSVPSTSAISRD